MPQISTIRRPDGFLAADCRPRLSVEAIAGLAAVFFVLACNRAFLQLFFSGRDWTQPYNWGFAAASVSVLILIYTGLFGLLFNRWTVKPLLVAFCLIASGAVYFADSYGVIFTTDMMRNVLGTDTGEAGDLLTPRLGLYVLGFGILPSILVLRLRIERLPIGRAIRRRAVFLAAILAMIAAIGAPVSRDIFATARNHGELNHMLVPTSVIVATVKAVAGEVEGGPKTAIGLDAKAAPPAATGRAPRTLVIVVGETARAANWGLNGYARQTTPELAKRDVVNFTKVSSCGTATEVSVPCMFSPYGFHNYDRKAIRSHEGLLDVVAHAGLSVLWRGNQPSCKGVCDRVPTEIVAKSEDPRFCEGSHCLDAILLDGLDHKIAAANGDQVIVLHQIGNHGPAYFERYPKEFRRYEPTCDTSELGDCDVSAIVNTYDNALLYTDHILASTIDILKAAKGRDTALFYVSDHGESLGEMNLFLHGMPYAIAPSVQTHVPMVMWLSPGMSRSIGLDTNCLAAKADEPTSQDALFQTVLGMMGISTSLYDPAFDLTASCRTAATG